MDTDKIPRGCVCVCVCVCVLCVCVCVCVWPRTGPEDSQHFREGRGDLGREPVQEQTACSKKTNKGRASRTRERLVPEGARD